MARRARVDADRIAIAPSPVKSIVVLPFRVLSSEKGDEYLSLGLADALITSLSQTRQVIVRQTEAVTKYVNKERDPLQAGREQGSEQKRSFKGIALNPNYPLLHHWRSLNLIAMGRLEEARDAMQRALQLDPLLLITNVNIGRIDYYKGRYDHAIDQYQRAIELDEKFSRTHLRLGMAYSQQGRYQEAISEYRKAREISGDTPQTDAHIAYVLAISGKKSEARAVLAALQKYATRDYVPPYDIALVYTGLGENDQAFQWLEKAYAEHSTEMIYFKVEPMLAPLRSDPRYQIILRRMGLAE